MDKTCKYYQYQRYVSYDNGQTWQPMNQFQRGELMEFNSPDCGAGVDALYKWEIVSGEFDCDGFDKYQKTQKYVSYDNGVTYNPVSPAEYGLGNLLEHNSTDCGYIVYDKYRWVDTGEIVCVEEEECEDIQALNLSSAVTVVRDNGDYFSKNKCYTMADVKGENYAKPTVDSPVKNLTINSGCWVDDIDGNHPMRYMTHLTALTVANNTTVYPPTYDVDYILVSRVGCGTQNIGALGKQAFVYSDDVATMSCHHVGDTGGCGNSYVYVPQNKLIDYRNEFGFDSYHGSRVGKPYILPLNSASYVMKHLFDDQNYSYQTRWVESGTTCDGFDKHKLIVKQERVLSSQTWTDTNETMVGELIEANSTDCGYIPPVSYAFQATLKEYDTGNLETYTVPCTSSAMTLTSAHTLGFSSQYPNHFMIECEIGNCVTTLGKRIFSGCSSLSSVTIASSVNYISEDIFYRAGHLVEKSIYCYAINPPTLIDYWSGYNIYVPQSSISLYQANSRWGDNNKIYPLT